jgi:MtN3 and saliva related transmembrane protein
MALSPLLQVRVVVRRRDSTGVSIAWPAVLFVGFVLWLLYGLVIGDVPLIVTNIVSGLVCLFTVVVLLRFRRARRRALAPGRHRQPLSVHDVD